MCLSQLDKTIKVKRYVGYKSFKRKKGKLLGEFRTLNKVRKTGQWLKAVDFQEEDEDEIRAGNSGEYYPAGWHVYLRRRDAVDYPCSYPCVVRKIRFRNVIAKGFESESTTDGIKCFPVIVCKEIYIEPERKST